MENNILLPDKFQIIEDKTNPYSVDLVVEPCASGYGLTIGNSLRRILLSSLEGSAVIAIKIKGAKHEFDTINGVKEDVIEMIVNIKNLVLKSYSKDVVIIELKKKGVGDVLASDIKPNSDIEVLNSNLKICTITNENTELDMKLWIKNGVGFYPIEDRKTKIDELGVIAIDAIFNPVLAANFKVEKTRVGDIVDLDRVILSVKTNGSIGPRKAIFDSLDLFLKNLELIKNNIIVQEDKDILVSKPSKKEEKPEKTSISKSKETKKAAQTKVTEKKEKKSSSTKTAAKSKK